MLNTFACYETFKGIAHDPTWDDDLIAEARQQHPEWCDEQVYTVGEFHSIYDETAGYVGTLAPGNALSRWIIEAADPHAPAGRKATA
jgi:hypothetical protein